MRAPIDDPVMEGFVARLEPLNALADASPGFVWRMQDEEGDATAIRVFDDELILFNMSVRQDGVIRPDKGRLGFNAEVQL